MTSSKCRAVRSMMSIWPFVTGSNDPGHRAVATQLPSTSRASRSLTTGSGGQDRDERIAVPPLPPEVPPYRDGDARARRPLDDDGRAGLEPTRRGERVEHAPDLHVGLVVGRIEERQPERRLPR